MLAGFLGGALSGLLRLRDAKAQTAQSAAASLPQAVELGFVPDRSAKGYIYERPAQWVYENRSVGSDTVDIWIGSEYNQLATKTHLGSVPAFGETFVTDTTYKVLKGGMETELKRNGIYDTDIGEEIDFAIDCNQAIRIATTMPPGAIIPRPDSIKVDQETRVVMYAFIRGEALYQISMTCANNDTDFTIEDANIRRVIYSVHFVQ